MLIDCESLYYLVRHEYPVHRQLHTFVGAALAGLVTTGFLLLARRLLRGLRDRIDAGSPAIRAEGSPLGILVGAMTGALTHPVLDGLMHHDIEPFQPWTGANPMQDVVSLSVLHTGCLIAGVIGAALIVLRRR